MPSTVRLHRVLGDEARQGLSRLCRGGRRREVAAAQRLCLHRASPRRESRRHLQDVIPQFHHGQQPFFRRKISGARARRALALHGQIRRSEFAGRNAGDGDTQTGPVGTELNVVQEGIPDAIPAEACYLGWQESLRNLARLVERRNQSIANRLASHPLAGNSLACFTQAASCASSSCSSSWMSR